MIYCGAAHSSLRFLDPTGWSSLEDYDLFAAYWANKRRRVSRAAPNGVIVMVRPLNAKGTAYVKPTFYNPPAACLEPVAGQPHERP